MRLALLVSVLGFLLVVAPAFTRTVLLGRSSGGPSASRFEPRTVNRVYSADRVRRRS
jgi:hypothetical protein